MVSASTSIKALPRKIELDEDEDETTLSLTANLSTTTALPSGGNTTSMQSHMNPTKHTEAASIAVDSERFGEEASTGERSEEGAADFKRVREEI
jgi:hypothetical protein